MTKRIQLHYQMEVNQPNEATLAEGHISSHEVRSCLTERMRPLTRYITDHRLGGLNDSRSGSSSSSYSCIRQDHRFKRKEGRVLLCYKYTNEYIWNQSKGCHGSLFQIGRIRKRQKNTFLETWWQDSSLAATRENCSRLLNNKNTSS